MRKNKLRFFAICNLRYYKIVSRLFFARENGFAFRTHEMSQTIYSYISSKMLRHFREFAFFSAMKIANRAGGGFHKLSFMNDKKLLARVCQAS